MFLIFLSLCFTAFFPIVSDDSIIQTISTSPFSAVLFFHENFPKLDDYIDTFNQLKSNSSGNCSFFGCSFHDKSEIVERFPIQFNPEILFFFGANFAYRYEGPCTYDALSKYISKLVFTRPKSKFLSSFAKLQKFSKKEPSNIIIYASSESPTYRSLIDQLHYYKFFTNIGYVTDYQVAYKNGVQQQPMIQINVPSDQRSILFNKYSVKSLMSHLTPTMRKLYYNQLPWSVARSTWVLFALVQQSNQTQLHQISRIMRHCKKSSRNLFMYAYGEYLDFYDIVKEIGIESQSKPTLIAYNSISLEVFNFPLLYKGELYPSDVRVWLNSLKKTSYKIYDITSNFNDSSPIPFISIKRVLDTIVPSTIAILLYGAPYGKNYDIQLRTLCKIRDVFMNSKNIKFFLSDPLTQSDISNLLLNCSSSTPTIYIFLENNQYIPIDTTNDFVNIISTILQFTKKKISKATQNYISTYYPNIFNEYINESAQTMSES